MAKTDIENTQDTNAIGVVCSALVRPSFVFGSDDGEPNFRSLVGPGGWECCLGEPEDALWCRDGEDAMTMLNELAARVKILSDFARTAPGRLPSNVTSALWPNMRICKTHNVSGIATYGDCPQCIKEQAQHGELKHSPEYLTKLLQECEDELELKTIAMANARKWESLSAMEVCAGNPAIAEYVASLESRLAQSKKLYALTLGNQMDWMRKWQEKSDEVEQLHAKDSVRTREYNTLVQENRELHAALSASEKR